jgi:threonine-phosphate decarboxylase
MAHGGDIYRNKVNTDFSVNLNPLGVPKTVSEAVLRSFDRVSEYPDITQEEIRQTIGDTFGVDKSFVFAGSGASELLMALVRAAAPARALLFEPGFSGYERSLEAVGCDIVHHELKKDSGYSVTDEDLKAIDSGIDIVFLCNPGNPAGRNIASEVLRKTLDAAKENECVVCLDESFFLMSDGALDDRTAYSGLLTRYDNLYIVNSLTKFLAMPGIRMGYVLSTPENIRKIIKQLPEWNLSVPAQAAMMEGMRLISGEDYVRETVNIIKTERTYLTRMLRDLGFEVFDSDTAFILFKGSKDLYEAILKEKILIRDCSDYVGLGRGFYRIAVKSHEENEKLIDALRGIVHEL